MRVLGIVLALLLVSVVFAGCTEPRDIESEAKEREEWARDHNAHRPVAVLSGPTSIAPGAVVWYSAAGSHDPDFFGARRDRERDEAQGAGGFHVQEDASDVQWSWSIHLDESRNDGLGNGIRRYEWSIDGGPPLVAHELTHRYGSLDGPLRFPVGFPEPGAHTLRLTVVDWSGERAHVDTRIDVAAGGTTSTVPGFAATERGWEAERIVPVSFEQYGDCPVIGRSQYDAGIHRTSIPWDLFFFMGELQVEAEWARNPELPAEAPRPTPPGLLPTPLAGTPPMPRLNTNDVALSLGHCETGDAWIEFDTDQDLLAEELLERGTVHGEELAGHIEITGAKSERRAEWDHNVYLSDKGDAQWGNGADVTYRLILVPAADTSHGGQ